MKTLPRLARLGCLALVLTSTACSSGLFEYSYPEPTVDPRADPRESGDPEETGLFGEGGINIFGGSNRRGTAEGGPGLGINSYLWRATLDTISFMPLASADPFGGVIITDWFAPPEAPGERFKMNVYILDRQLRADGLRVAVFRQERNGTGGWTDSPVKAETATLLENQILTRARQLRVNSANQ